MGEEEKDEPPHSPEELSAINACKASSPIDYGRVSIHASRIYDDRCKLWVCQTGEYVPEKEPGTNYVKKRENGKVTFRIKEDPKRAKEDKINGTITYDTNKGEWTISFDTWDTLYMQNTSNRVVVNHHPVCKNLQFWGTTGSKK